MTQLLAGRRAVVTGAARGIGLVVAERFAAEGAAVLIADVDADGAQRASDRLAATSGRAIAAATVDVTDEDSVDALVQHARVELGGVDVVVANAGILLLRHVVETGLDDWRRVLDVNLTGTFLTCRAFARHMIGTGGGRIIVSSSLFGLRGGRENAAYSASKFGLVGLVQSLAAEVAAHGVLVNAVCPGQVDTVMMQQLFTDRAALMGTSPAAVEAELTARIPLGRMGTPEEIADIYVFLASGLSRYITGQALVADGGWQVG